MSDGNSDLGHPYPHLGQVLERWRESKYRSIAAMLENETFSFSYGRYASYERGEVLPAVEVILELAQRLAQDPREAVCAWVQAQIPSGAVRDAFSFAKIAHQPLDTPPPNGADQTKTPDLRDQLDYSWIFGKLDLKAFEKDPWLFDFLVHLHMMSPTPMPIADLGFETRAAFRAFETKYLQRWIDDGKIAIEDEKIRLVFPFFRLPKTELFEEFRRQVVRNTAAQLIDRLNERDIATGSMVRARTWKLLTQEQRKFAFDTLAEAERRIFALKYDPDPKKEKTRIGFVLLAGPIESELPAKLRALKAQRG